VHEPFFGAPLAFGAARVELKLRESDLRRTPLRADRMLREFFERYCEELFHRMGHLPANIPCIKGAIAEELRGGVPCLTAVASRLAVGDRTLRRQLQKQGLSFRALVDLTRSEMAREYLEQSLLSISEIAYLLGFSGASAFHRAFRRWTGMAPLRYREQSGRRLSCA
jgi:AraC-like DNA-binding protein